MSENGTNGLNVSATAVENDADDLERKELELKRKERDPPIVFPNTIHVGLNTRIFKYYLIVTIKFRYLHIILNDVYLIELIYKYRYRTNWND